MILGLGLWAPFAYNPIINTIINPVVNPVSTLFANAEQGGWYDPSDLSTLYQDAAGTIPVTAVGQPVGKALDASGNGNHLTFTNVLLGQDGNGKYYLATTSASSGTTSTLNLAGKDKATIWMATSLDSGEMSTVVRLGNVVTQAGSFDFGYYQTGILLYRSGSGSFGARGTPPLGAGAVVSVASVNLSGTTSETEVPTLRVDSIQPALTQYGAADTGAGTWGNYPLTLFQGQAPFIGKLYGLIIRFAQSTAEQEQLGEKFLTSKVRDLAAFTLRPTEFSDTGAAIGQGGYVQTSVFSRTVFATDATSIAVTAYNNIFTAFPQHAELGVRVNGVYNQTIPMGAPGQMRKSITLPPGAKTVEIVSGLQSKPSDTVIGTWLVEVGADSPVTQLFPAPLDRILFYGDSITAGGNATTITSDAYVVKVRQATTRSVAAEAYGYRSLFDDCNTAPLRAAFVAKMAAYNPATIWLAIGTNDYGLNRWTAAAFGAAYAALLDDLHAALPAALIYAQTPIVRSSEGANSQGSTLAGYRSQIGAAVSTRSAYATLVDGTAFMTTASLDDGVHPTTAGHTLYANAVKSVLGIL